MTPGSWDWTGPRKRVWLRKLADGTAEDVKTLYQVDGRPRHGERFSRVVAYVEFEDDARIIAAVPEMFELIDILAEQGDRRAMEIIERINK